MTWPIRAIWTYFLMVAWLPIKRRIKKQPFIGMTLQTGEGDRFVIVDVENSTTLTVRGLSGKCLGSGTGEVTVSHNPMEW